MTTSKEMVVTDEMKADVVDLQSEHERIRASWPAGPWDDEPDEWEGPTDYLSGVGIYAVRNPTFGHWCGYVTLPERHPLWGADMWATSNLAVHWGVSYADYPFWSDDFAEDVWALGFDCQHAWDISPGMMGVYGQIATASANRLLGAMTASLVGDFENARSPFGGVSVYRNLEYVKTECLNLQAQVTHRVLTPGSGKIHSRKRGEFVRTAKEPARRKRVPRGPGPLSVRYVRR